MRVSTSSFSVPRGYVAAETRDRRRTSIEPAPPDEPQPAPPVEPDEPSDLDELEFPRTDDADWDVFIADDDQVDPLPDRGDFWIEDPAPE